MLLTLLLLPPAQAWMTGLYVGGTEYVPPPQVGGHWAVGTQLAAGQQPGGCTDSTAGQAASGTGRSARCVCMHACRCRLPPKQHRCSPTTCLGPTPSGQRAMPYYRYDADQYDTWHSLVGLACTAVGAAGCVWVASRVVPLQELCSGQRQGAPLVQERGAGAGLWRGQQGRGGGWWQ
jgi:hypothetical protein